MSGNRITKDFSAYSWMQIFGGDVIQHQNSLVK